MRIQLRLFAAPLLAGVTWLTATEAVHAVFVEFDTFDALTAGTNIDGQNGWVAPNGPPAEGFRQVSIDPIHAGNNVVEIFESGASDPNGLGPHLWKSLGANSAPNADTAHTAYLRFMIPAYDPATAGFPTASFALRNGPQTDNQAIGMGPHVLVRGLGDGTNVMQVRPDQYGSAGDPGFLTLDTSTITGATFDTNTWYDLWMVTNNSADTFNLYVQGGDFATQTQLQVELPDTSVVTDIAFRDLRVPGEGGVLDADLDYFWIRPNADHDNHTIYFDHVFVDDGENLTTPAFPDYAMPTLTVDRITGAMTLDNLSSTVAMGLRGYSITSVSGALREENWLSIADNYDAGAGGPIDGDDEWTKLTAAGAKYDLSEYQFGGDGGALGTSVHLALSEGDGTWLPTFNEWDLEATLVYPDGTQQKIAVTYTGNGGEPLLRSDLDHDGSLTGDDWLIYIAHDLTDVSALTPAEAYLLGDINLDLLIDAVDFQLFKADYNAANGAGSFEAMLQSIPEPSSLILLGFGVFGLAAVRLRNQLLRI